MRARKICTSLRIHECFPILLGRLLYMQSQTFCVYLVLSYICISDFIASGYNNTKNEIVSIMVDSDTNQLETSTKSEEDVINVASDAPEDISTKEEPNKEEETNEEENKEDAALAKRRKNAQTHLLTTFCLPPNCLPSPFPPHSSYLLSTV